MIDIIEGIQYNPDLEFEEQSEEFKEYFWAEYEKVPKIVEGEYPDFDSEGNISYSFSDDILNYSVKRIQEYSFSQSNRSVKENVISINIK